MRRPRSAGRWASEGLLTALLCGIAPVAAHADPLATVDRNGALVSAESYAPGIVRVTIATDRSQAITPPRYGIVAKAEAAGWTCPADAADDYLRRAHWTSRWQTRPGRRTEPDGAEFRTIAAARRHHPEETAPDLVPDGYFYSIGSGDRYHNAFPLLHTASVADGSARDRPTLRNLILCRAACLGAQANGANGQRRLGGTSDGGCRAATMLRIPLFRLP